MMIPVILARLAGRRVARLASPPSQQSRRPLKLCRISRWRVPASGCRSLAAGRSRPGGAGWPPRLRRSRPSGAGWRPHL